LQRTDDRLTAGELGMIVDDDERVDVDDNRLAAATIQRVRHSHTQHQPRRLRPGLEFEPRVTDIHVTCRGCDRCSARKLDYVDIAIVVDCQQDVIRLDCRVIDDNGALPRSPDEMPARLQLRPPTRVWSSRHFNPHAPLRVATASHRKPCTCLRS
jgi:hypothetical protein